VRPTRHGLSVGLLPDQSQARRTERDTDEHDNHKKKIRHCRSPERGSRIELAHPGDLGCVP
jgi:hypothetical protein